VTFIGRERIKWEIDMKGMTLTHFKRAPIHIERESIDYQLRDEALAQADLVLLCVKSQDTAIAAKSLKKLAKPETLVVSFQNGVSNPEIIRHITGLPTLGAIVPFNVTSTQTGEFHSGTEGDLIIENSADKRLGSLVKAFRKSKMGVILTDEISDYQWGKLLVNLNNALSALLGGTLREGLSQKSYRKVLAAMMEEGLNVCKKAGIHPKSFGKASVQKTLKILRMPNVLFGPVMNNVIKIDKEARSSMLDDLEGGRVSEIDFLQGEIVRLAERTGQFAPINLRIQQEVEAAFAVHKTPQYSGKDMLDLLGDLV